MPDLAPSPFFPRSFVWLGLLAALSTADRHHQRPAPAAEPAAEYTRTLSIAQLYEHGVDLHRQRVRVRGFTRHRVLSPLMAGYPEACGGGNTSSHLWLTERPGDEFGRSIWVPQLRCCGDEGTTLCDFDPTARAYEVVGTLRGSPFGLLELTEIDLTASARLDGPGELFALTPGPIRGGQTALRLRDPSAPHLTVDPEARNMRELVMRQLQEAKKRSVEAARRTRGSAAPVSPDPEPWPAGL